MINVTDYNSYINRVAVPLSEIRKAGIYQCNGQETPKQWYDRQIDKPDIVCNCGFFEWSAVLSKFLPCYTLKIDNEMKRKDSLYRGLAIKDNKFEIGMIDNIPSEDFVSGVPVLTVSGKSELTAGIVEMLKDISGYNPRTVFGFSETEALLLAIDGRQKNKLGATLEELPYICLRNGLTNAVNFDGGASSMVVVDGKIINISAGYRGVHNVLAIWAGGKVEMEWKEPNWNWIWTKYAQVDRDGKVKVQNNDYGIAKMNAEKDGYAVWEKATKTRIYPIATVKPEPDKPEPVKPADTGEKEFLQELKGTIDERLKKL